MKHADISKQLREESTQYIEELQALLTSRMVEVKALPVPARAYELLFPLWALLRTLADGPYSRDVTKELVLRRLRDKGDLDGFVEAAKRFRPSSRFEQLASAATRDEEFNAYFAELFSDSVLLTNSVFLASYRSAAIALRCMLEDLYRHLYYKDHQEEYLLIFEREGAEEHRVGLSPASFREYLGRASYLEPFKVVDVLFRPTKDPKKTLFGLSDSLYSQTSSFVHGSKAHAQGGLKSISDIQHDAAKEERVLSLVEQFVQLAVSFLIAAHRDSFLSFDDYAKSTVMLGWNAQATSRFRQLLSV